MYVVFIAFADKCACTVNEQCYSRMMPYVYVSANFAETACQCEKWSDYTGLRQFKLVSDDY